MAERAAQNPSTEFIAKLKEMSSVSYHLDDPQSHINFLRTNRDFHLTLAESAKNLRLVEVLEELFHEMERLFHLGLRLRDSSEEMMREHQEVVSALENGDVERVQSIVSQQIEASRDRILEAIMQGTLQYVQLG